MFSTCLFCCNFATILLFTSSLPKGSRFCFSYLKNDCFGGFSRKRSRRLRVRFLSAVPARGLGCLGTPSRGPKPALYSSLNTPCGTKKKAMRHLVAPHKQPQIQQSPPPRTGQQLPSGTPCVDNSFVGCICTRVVQLKDFGPLNTRCS